MQIPCPSGQLPGRLLSAVLLLTAFFAFARPATAELEVTGQKEFHYRGYSQTGSFSQFIGDNGTFLTGTGFEQSLRLDVHGTIFDDVRLELSFDDSLTSREDQKLLVNIATPDWQAAAGRVALQLDDTKYLVYNKKALGFEATGLFGSHLLTFMAARPEGRQRRQVFRGNGSQQEFVLSDANGKKNPRLVQGSDAVYLDSRRLERGKDYDIDYEEGSIVLKHNVLPIEPTSILTVEFETTDTESSNTGTFLGIRDRYYFDGLDDVSDRDPEDEYVAVSLVTNVEEGQKPAIGPPLSTRLTVGGMDGQKDIGENLLLKGELALSRLEADSSSTGIPTVEGHAIDLDLARTEGRLTFDLAHQEVGPGFQAIGRKEFLRLNERSDLIGDVRSTRLDSEYDLNRRVTANVKIDRATTNLDDNPALQTIDFEAVLAGVSYDFQNERSLALRRRAERQDNQRPGGVSGNQDRDVFTATGKMPLFGLSAQAAFESDDNETTLADGNGTDFITRRFNIGSGPASKIGWSTSIEDQKRPGLGESKSGQLLLDVSPLKTLKGNISLLRRVDSGRQSATTTVNDEEGTTDTGEVRLRFEPSQELHVDVKGSAEQRNRIALVRDPRLPPLTVIDPNAPRTIVTQNPILKLNGSDTIEWRPSRTYDHRLQFRINREQDKVTDLVFSQNDVANYRLKYAPTEKLRFVTEWEKGATFNKLAPVDTDQETRTLSVMNAFPRGLSATLSRKSIDSDDHVVRATESELSHGLSLEKILSRILTAEAGVERKDRSGRFNDDAWTAKAGVRYSPEKLPLRTEVNLEHSTIDGTTTAGAPLESFKDKVSLRADYRVNPQTLVVVSGDVTDAGPTVAGDPGYKAIAGEAKVSISF